MHRHRSSVGGTAGFSCCTHGRRRRRRRWRRRKGCAFMQGRLLLTMPALSLCSVSRAVKVRYISPPPIFNFKGVVRGAHCRHVWAGMRSKGSITGAVPREVLQGQRGRLEWTRQLFTALRAVNPILYPLCHIEGEINRVLQ